LLGYAAVGHALAVLVNDTDDSLARKWRSYAPPAKKIDGDQGGLADRVLYGKSQYAWKDQEFILDLVDGRDGIGSFPVRNNYIDGDEAAVNQLIFELVKYTTSLHNEIWVFNKGYWSKDRELWKSTSHASSDDVILDSKVKQTLIDEVTRSFESRSTYTNLKAPWKRGLIFYGPPRNGKTISIKATMNTLYQRQKPVPTLYVKTLVRSAQS
jgi:transitional endoplasmic reticulum ATPase